MQIRVYEGEKYNRSRTWYIVAGSIYGIIVVLALFGGNLAGGADGRLPTWGGAFAAALLLILAWVYRKFYRHTLDKPVQMSVDDGGISIGFSEYPRDDLRAFALEAQVESGEIHNLVLFTHNGHQIYTFATNDQEKIKDVAMEIGDHLPLVKDFTQSFVEKRTRRLQI